MDSFHRKKRSENTIHKIPSTSFPLPSWFWWWVLQDSPITLLALPPSPLSLSCTSCALKNSCLGTRTREQFPSGWELKCCFSSGVCSEPQSMIRDFSKLRPSTKNQCSKIKQINLTQPELIHPWTGNEQAFAQQRTISCSRGRKEWEKSGCKQELRSHY